MIKAAIQTPLYRCMPALLKKGWIGIILIKKALVYCKKRGLKSAFMRALQKTVEVAQRVPSIVLEPFVREKVFNQLRKAVAGKQVFVMIPCIDWNIPIFQRPHQIASVLAARKNAIVLFISDQYQYDNFACCRPIEDNLYLYSHRMVEYLDKVLVHADSVVTIMSWMRHANWLQQFHYDKFIYEYIDELSLFYYHTVEMEHTHEQLMQTADATICTARSLYEKALPVAKHAVFSPNAGDYTFFHENQGCQVHPLIKDVITNYECVFGYYGCLASWFDYELVIQVAVRKPSWAFVLIGYDFDGTSEQLKKELLPNIILIPAQPYSQLPSFVSGVDIQCIPFVVNDITCSTSPIKLFEYMASGKPILTSRLPECLQYQSVFTYDGADDFITQAMRIFPLKFDNSYIQLLNQEAQQNTWQARVDEMLTIIN